MTAEDLFTPQVAIARRTKRFPEWLRRKLPYGGEHAKTDSLLKKHGMHLVCEEAKCPNRSECYANKTATFLALGKVCTRACGFCDIDFCQAPPPIDPSEPKRIALSAQQLGLRHVVITMVTRDDLPDGGAQAIAAIIKKVRSHLPQVTIETLTSDFAGNLDALRMVLDAKPDLFNHNVETVRRLTPKVRHRATYDRSLHILQTAKESGKCAHIKSGIMVGLGETLEEIQEALRDLQGVGCSCVTIGQYLQAGPKKLRVKEFITPNVFKELEVYGLSIGIAKMFCGPFVRSSYHAGNIFSSSK